MNVFRPICIAFRSPLHSASISADKDSKRATGILPSKLTTVAKFLVELNPDKQRPCNAASFRASERSHS